MSGVGALVAVISEAWPSQWDDNAKIPFWTGLIVWAAALLLGLPLLYN
jgi:dolichol kinase